MHLEAVAVIRQVHGSDVRNDWIDGFHHCAVIVWIVGGSPVPVCLRA
jgi:hypothetical protein